MRRLELGFALQTTAAPARLSHVAPEHVDSSSEEDVVVDETASSMQTSDAIREFQLGVRRGHGGTLERVSNLSTVQRTSLIPQLPRPPTLLPEEIPLPLTLAVDQPPLLYPICRQLLLLPQPHYSQIDIVSTWDRPAIRHVSPISLDFSFANKAFASFLDVYGKQPEELRLANSADTIEEPWLTLSPHTLTFTPISSDNSVTTCRFGSTRAALPEGCSNLETLVCSADIAWNWENSD
ncbi:hypothetical protein BKA70DRAFT_1576511 [Coprinopsis sp. MPI-PUGE-AT-0042]|nr:hypothetical protein BKA70DRAFT_1576511 [Coprinopsis sp. MPI-PUGE-AT-0042]